MTSDEVNDRLTTIRENLAPQYSQSAARKLMSSYENYKHILEVLGHSYPGISTAVRSLPDIEMAIRQAIKGTPKKEAEEAFGQARRMITEGINAVLAAGGHKSS